MAKKQSSVTYEGIMRDLRAGKFAPIYILMGEEPYYIDRITDLLETAVVPEESRDFNQTVCYGSDVSAASVADMARRFPMMSDRQLILVKEAQNIKNWDRLEQYFERPQPTTVLAIAYKNGKIDGRKKILHKAVAAGGVVYESEKMKEWALTGFIERYVAEKSASIDPKAAQMVAEHVGADLCRVASELDKVMGTLSDNQRRITPELVEEKIGVSKDYNGYELKTAIACRDVEKANRVLNYYANNPKTGSPFVLIITIFNYFRDLLTVYYAENKTEQGIAKYLGLPHTAMARDYVLGLRNYSAGKVVRILRKIRETDAKSKGLDNYSSTAGDLVRELLFFIFY